VVPIPPGGIIIAQVVRPTEVQSIRVLTPSRHATIAVPSQRVVVGVLGGGTMHSVARGTHVARPRASVMQVRPIEAQSERISRRMVVIGSTRWSAQSTAESPSQREPGVVHGVAGWQNNLCRLHVDHGAVAPRLRVAHRVAQRLVVGSSCAFVVIRIRRRSLTP
jgi:hypothetical protein